MSREAGAAEPASRSADGQTPVADRIRERIRKARGRFRANDNIAAYIEDGELDELRLEVAEKLEGVLQALVIDTASCATRATGRSLFSTTPRSVSGVSLPGGWATST